MKNKTRVICTVLTVLLILSVFSGCKAENTPISSSDTASPERLEVTKFDEPVYLVNAAVKKYLETEPKITIADAIKGIDTEDRFDGENPVVIGYTLNNASDVAESAYIEISEKDGEKKTKNFENGKNEVALTFLTPSRTYDYTVFVTLSDGTVLKNGGSFETATTPHILTVPNVKNVRDIGGWKTDSGKRVKYGMIYRGGEFDGWKENEYVATDVGLSVMRDTMNIRFDCDLRDVKMNSEPGVLGADVKRCGYGCWEYNRALTEDHGREVIFKVFTELADENNYPVYVHCTYGRDRTGTVCFLIEMLLGVSLDDAVRDYELTAIAFPGLTRYSGNENSNFMKMVSELNTYPGKTYSEKCENYLKTLGITKTQIAKIKSMMLDN